MLGTLIEAKRKEHGLSRSKLARMLEISESYIVQIERQNRIPSVKKLSELADVFSCSVDELLGRTTVVSN